MNGTLQHELYMEQTERFKDGSTKVCKLEKSIYGLKQAAVVSYDTLKDLLSINGYEPSTRETCLFLKKPGCGPGPD